MGSLHDVRFPGESGEYRAARDALLRDEMELRDQLERVAARRRALPLGGEIATDYAFEELDATGGPRRIALSELFEDGKDTLFLYSFMWVPQSQGLGFVGPCPSCTSIIDGIDGAVPHILQRASFAVAAKATIELFLAPRDDPDQGPRHVDFMWPMWSVLDSTPVGRGEFDPSLHY